MQRGDGLEPVVNSADALKRWLSNRPPEYAQLIATRIALRVFPYVVGLVREKEQSVSLMDRQHILLLSFRSAFTSWAACKYSSPAIQSAAAGAAIATAAGGIIRTAVRKAGASVVLPKHLVAAATAAADAGTRAAAATGARAAAHDAAIGAAENAVSAIQGTDPVFGPETLWNAIAVDCRHMEAEGVAGAIDRPLWPLETVVGPLSHGSVPGWSRTFFDHLAKSELGGTSFDLVGTWYQAVEFVSGRRSTYGLFGEMADRELAAKPDEFWKVTENRSAERIMDEVAGVAGWEGRREGPESAVTMQEFIIRILEESGRPLSLDEIEARFREAGLKSPDYSIRGRVNELVELEQIVRVDRGLYASKNWRPEEAAEPEWDFFLSYSKDDVLVAKRISDTLETAGHTVFSQFSDMTAGKSFVREMNRGLGGMGRLIAVYSPSYFSSEPCQAEWEAAYTYDASGERGKIVPFLVRPCEPTPLARRLVWTPLIGLDPDAERKAVLDAVRDPTAPRDRASQRVALKQAVSPDVTADKSGRLDAAPNFVFDDPFVDVDLLDLPELLRTLIQTACSALEGRNRPSGLVHALKSYSAELEARGVNCSFGVLRGQMDFIEAEIDDPAAEFWLTGAGLRKTLENLRKAHTKLGTHYPLDQSRERLIRAIEVDRAKTDGTDFQEIEKEIAKAIDSALEDDIVTDNYHSVSANRRRVSRDILELKTPPIPTEGDEAYVQRETDRVRRIQDAKKRALAQQVGFADKSLDVLTKLTTVADSSTARRLAEAFGKLVDWFW